MSWSKINKPGFFLIGAAKSGTTSFYDYFKKHPSLYVTPLKEPNYFGSDIDPKNFRKAYKNVYVNNLDQYFKNTPLQELHFAFVDNEEDYIKLFLENKENALAGDCSSTYLFSQAAAEEIKKFNPNAKIVVSLRNPMERAFSHYLMALQMGLVSGNFIEEFEKDRACKDKGFGKSELFYELGLYANQLKKYIDAFGVENVLVLKFDDWVSWEEETQEKICQFLNVSIFTDLNKEGSNISRSVRNKKLHQRIMQSSLKEKLIQVLPDSLKEKAKQVYYKKDKTVLSLEERKLLLSLYKEDIMETQELVKLDLSNWLKI